MKKSSILLAGLSTTLLVLSSCADDVFKSTIDDLEKYAPVKDYSSLNLDEYAALKTYVDRSANPNFKLGTGITVSDYVKKQGVYLLANDNYDELTAGNAMKMSSVVSAEGDMDYSTVESFVDAAEEAGLSVYGHTLAWHSQQPKKWLDKLIADKVISVGATDEEMFNFTFDDGNSFGGWGNSATFEVVAEGVDGTNCLKITNPSAVVFYGVQAAVDMAYEANREYVLKFKVKGSSDGVLRAGFQNSSNYAGCGDFPDMPFTTDWTDVRVSTTASEGVNRFLFSLGDFEGSLFLDNVQMIKKATGGNKSMSLRPAVVEFASLFANDKFVRQGVNKASGANYRAIKVPATAKVSQPWDNQFFIRSTQTFKAGDVTHISFRYRATKAASVGTQCHNEPGSYRHWMAIGNVAFTDEWQEFDMDFTVPAEADGMRTIAFNLNDFAEENDYYFDDWSWTIGGVECIVNGNCEGDDNSCFFSTVATVGPNPSQIVEIAFPSIVVHATAKASQAWDNQFFIVSNEALPAGTATHISFTYKATAAAKASTQCHDAPGAYRHWFAIGDVQFSKEWQDFDYDFTVPSDADGMKTIAFNLSEFADANDYYIRNVKWTLNGKDLINNGDLTGDDFSSFVTRIYQQADVNSKPEEVSVFEKQEEGTVTIKLTPEEKKDTLTWAMDKWIKGMMEVTAGRVKAWDVVNEPIGGFDGDGDGKYDLQHASTATDDDKKNNFYWQDYLGDVDYVRIAISRARMYYKQYGGNPDDLKLFINDYNLESNWDDNAKLKGLIAWCNEWENDTIKIDGIGTQMHVSYDVRQGVMDSQKQHIVNMFRLMAATGKLVKISELDMGYVDANGDPVMTKDITVDQEIQMSDFYNFIVKAYFENVPASQRYGITLWSPTDSPAGSGWRGGQPIGLWTEGYQRKPAYAGVADGLAGK